MVKTPYPTGQKTPEGMCRQWPGEPDIDCNEFSLWRDLLDKMLRLNLTNDEIGSVLLFTGRCDTIITAKYYHDMHHISWFDPKQFDARKLTAIANDRNPVSPEFGVPNSIAEKTLFKFVTDQDFTDGTEKELKAVDLHLFTPDRVFNVAMPRIIKNLFSLSKRVSMVLNYPLVTYRGIEIATRNLELCDLEIGDPIYINNFMSTSISCLVAGYFMGKSRLTALRTTGKTKCGVMYKFLIPPHTRCIPTMGIHYLPEECEIILVPDKKVNWHVTDKDITTNYNGQPTLLLTVEGKHQDQNSGTCLGFFDAI